MAGERFDTCLLDRALEEKRRALEEECRQVMERVLAALDRWGTAWGIRRAYLFGSVTRPGRFRWDSDVDLAVEEVDPRCFFRAWEILMSEAGRPPDLVELADCPFADGIRQEGIP